MLVRFQSDVRDLLWGLVPALSQKQVKQSTAGPEVSFPSIRDGKIDVKCGRVRIS